MYNTPFVVLFALLLSFPLLFLFGPRLLSPRHVEISMADELHDLALFRRATLADMEISNKHHPRHRVRMGSTNDAASAASSHPKIAFLFLTNSDLHFAPLWEKFFANRSSLFNIYIHADPTVKVADPGGVFADRFIPGRKTERASPTLISATRRLLAHALLEDPRNTYFAVVSQHCIPLRSFDYLYNSLFKKQISESAVNSHRAFRSFIEILAGEPQMWSRYIARGEDTMLPEVPFSQFRIGSQFFVLNRAHASLVIKDRKLWRKFKLPCLNIHSCYPEEHYFPTLLSMEDPEGATHYTLTRVNWTGMVDGHPHTYEPAEVSPKLIRELRVSNSTFSYMFARKFAPDCLKPLLYMADKVIFRD